MSVIDNESATALEHLDVLVVGAGISGVAAAHSLQTKAPWARYAIFESRPSMGGTWDLFRYPGIRSDSDMFTLGFSFRPWEGEKAIAGGDSILDYVKDTARHEGIDRHIRYQHRVLSAAWSTERAVWNVTAERSDSGEQVELTASFLFCCTGYYRYDRGYLPDFAGLEEFEGHLVHPQQWPEDLDYRDKRVVVIGSGATAVTLIPAMAEAAGHVTMLQRSPTYIAPAPDENPLLQGLRRITPGRWSNKVVRWLLAATSGWMYNFSRKRPEVVKRFLLSAVRKALPDGYDVDTHFTPTYNPWDQRMCVAPGGDLFKAISAGQASVVTDHIDRFTRHGVRLTSGDELEADIIVSATGLEMLFLGGIELTVDGEKVDPATRLTYKGMMLHGVPNLAFAIGYTNASWTLKAELTCDYVTRLLKRMRASGLRQCTPQHVDDTVTAQPLLPLTSGYVMRAADRFPKQGDRFPWQVHQNYLRDYRAMRLSRVEDDSMVFSNRSPVGGSTPARQPVLTRR